MIGCLCNRCGAFNKDNLLLGTCSTHRLYQLFVCPSACPCRTQNNMSYCLPSSVRTPAVAQQSPLHPTPCVLSHTIRQPFQQLWPSQLQHRHTHTKASSTPGDAGASSSNGSSPWGFLRKWQQDSKHMQEQLKALGAAGVIAYGEHPSTVPKVKSASKPDRSSAGQPVRPI